ncbi:MAG: hypothetical protein HN348_28545, partial [Proteobacteria bacterium]|nr:hypothetical protein [Pseudomonadota bacterium]
PKTLAHRLTALLNELVSNQHHTPRHRSVRVAIEGSWKALNPYQQEALGQLSVFDGGFGLEAAESVVELGPQAPPFLEIMESLVHWSLVRFFPSDSGETRYWQFASICEFGRETLPRTAQVAAEERHYQHYAKRCRYWVDALWGPDEMHCYLAINDEYQNLLAAFRRGINCDAEEAVDIFRVLDVVLAHRGPRNLRQSMLHQLETHSEQLSAEARFQVALLSASSGEPERTAEAMSLAATDSQRLRVMNLEAGHHLRRGDALQVSELENKLRKMVVESEEPRLSVEVLHNLASARHFTKGRHEAVPLFQECMALSERYRLPWHRDHSWTALFWIGEYANQQVEQTDFDAVLERTRLRGFRLEEANLLRGYSLALRAQYRFGEATQALHDARVCCREVGAHRLDAMVCLSIGRGTIDPIEAEKFFQYALSWFEDHEDARSAALVLAVMAMLRLRQPNADDDAIARLRQAVDAFAACGDEYASTELEMELAVMQHLGGDPRGAVERFGVLSSTPGLLAELGQRMRCRMGAAAAAMGELGLAGHCFEGGHPLGMAVTDLYLPHLAMAEGNTTEARRVLLSLLTPTAERERRPPFLDNDEMLIAARLLHWSLSHHGVCLDETLVPWL